MRQLARIFLVVGILSVAFGLASCYRYETRVGSQLSSHQNPEGDPQLVTTFGRFLCAIAGGIMALICTGRQLGMEYPRQMSTG
jgi:hypothetical protein